MWHRTRDLMACSIVPEPTTLPRANYNRVTQIKHSAVGIATGYVLDDREVGVRVQVRQEFLFLHVFQTGFWVHPTSYSMEVKRPGRETDH
jgi:hypothetical protein